MNDQKRAKIFLIVCLAVLFVGLNAQAVFAQPSPYTVVGGTSTVFFSSDRVTGSNPEGDYEIFRMDDDGSNVVQLTFNAAMDWHSVANDDGTQLTFASDRDGDQEIFVMNADGSGQTQITSNTVFDGHPFPKPGAGAISDIVFSRNYAGELDNEIVRTTTSSVETRLTTNGGNDSHAAWGTTGLIAYGSDADGDWEIYTMSEVDGSSKTKITSNIWLDAAPSWNWDSSKIVFHSKPVDSIDVYTMNANGTGRALVINTDGQFFDGIPWYSSTTQTIVYTSEGLGADWDSEIVKINSVDGSGKTPLTANAPPTEDLWVPYLALLGQDPGSSCDLKAENPQNPHYIPPTGVNTFVGVWFGFAAIAAGSLLFFRERRRRSYQLV